jgi:hypothetical protein
VVEDSALDPVLSVAQARIILNKDTKGPLRVVSGAKLTAELRQRKRLWVCKQPPNNSPSWTPPPPIHNVFPKQNVSRSIALINYRNSHDLVVFPRFRLSPYRYNCCMHHELKCATLPSMGWNHIWFYYMQKNQYYDSLNADSQCLVQTIANEWWKQIVWVVIYYLYSSSFIQESSLLDSRMLSQPFVRITIFAQVHPICSIHNFRSHLVILISISYDLGSFSNRGSNESVGWSTSGPQLLYFHSTDRYRFLSEIFFGYDQDLSFFYYYLFVYLSLLLRYLGIICSVPWHIDWGLPDLSENLMLHWSHIRFERHVIEIAGSYWACL